MSDQFALNGRAALVTGASRGIGRAIALGLARAGADVAVAARTTSALAEVAAQIEAIGRRAVVLTCDVDDPAQVEATFAAAVDAFGGLQVLVNNAGGFVHVGPFLALRPADWTAMLRTNLESVAHFCWVGGRYLTAQGSGSVINVASVGGYSGLPMMSPYAVAKAGVISLTRTLAAEWAQYGVRVNAIAPGWTATQLTSAFDANQELARELIRAVPISRWGDPEDLAGAAVYLAADAARMVTGTCLTVDGGVTCYNTGPAMIDLLRSGRIPV